MINILCLFLLNTMYFVCNLYPKHIVEVNSPFSVVINLLFYILLSVLLVISISKNKNVFSKHIFSPLEKFSQKVEIKKIVLIIAIKIAFDIILLLLNSILKSNVLYAYDFATVLIWVILYNVCAGKENNLFLKKKGSFVIAALLGLLSLSTIGNYEIIKEYSDMLLKYYSGHARLENVINNYDFLFGVKNFFLDTLTGAILILSHCVFNKTGEKEQKIVVKLIIRSSFLIFIAIVLMGIKYLVLPVNCLLNVNIRGSDSNENSQSSGFDANTKITRINRIANSSIEKTVYLKTENQILYNGAVVSEYDSADDLAAYSFEINGNQMAMNGRFQKLDIESECYLYKDEAICFVEDGVPVVVCSGNEKIKKYDTLTTAYKYIIENEYWEFFDSASIYLLEYDSDFINPYLNRYSKGEFSADELNSLDEAQIKTDYIKQISNKIG